MKKYTRQLPAGWYPETEKEIFDIIRSWGDSEKRIGYAAVVPHAGWYFSGKLAYSGIKAISSEVETVVVCGGHLSKGSKPIFYRYNQFETPLGPLNNDDHLLDFIDNAVECDEELYVDNTVEIQLPLIKAYRPDVQVVCMRIPPNFNAMKVAEICDEYENAWKTKLFILGSTDLTHYGPNYQFSPHGTGEDGYRWVRDVNDKNMLNAMIIMDGQRILDQSINDRSACSGGAAATAAVFARKKGCKKGFCIGYENSYMKHKDASFVGYAAITYQL